MTDSDAPAEATAGSALAAAGGSEAVPLNGSVEARPLVPGAATATAAPLTASIRDDDPSAQAAQPSQLTRKKRGRRGKGRNKHLSVGPAIGPAPAFTRNLLAVGTPAEPSPVVTALASPEGDAVLLPVAFEAPGLPGLPVSTDASGAGEAYGGVASGSGPDSSSSDTASEDPSGEPIATATWAPWAPKMPPIAASPSVPWRKPAYAGSAVAASSVVVPSLVIDDADPESAERIIEERAEKHAPRRSFLPPILLDREDRSARQGGLTLAVIILLIAATLTLSYLMRRPSAGGDGMTRLDTPSGAIDFPAHG